MTSKITLTEKQKQHLSQFLSASSSDWYYFPTKKMVYKSLTEYNSLYKNSPERTVRSISEKQKQELSQSLRFDFWYFGFIPSTQKDMYQRLTVYNKRMREKYDF